MLSYTYVIDNIIILVLCRWKHIVTVQFNSIALCKRVLRRWKCWHKKRIHLKLSENKIIKYKRKQSIQGVMAWLKYLNNIKKIERIAKDKVLIK